MKSVTFDCPSCNAHQTLALATPDSPTLEFSCAACAKPLLFNRLDQKTLFACPACGCKDLHQHKDFNKTLGLVIFAVGAILSFWTYHVSLFAALLIDAALYPLFPWMTVCYKCRAEIRGWPKNPELDRFSHEVASHYENYGG